MIEIGLISEYLIENNFADSYESAVNMITVMSESWLEHILDDEIEYLSERKDTKVRYRMDPETGKYTWQIVPTKDTPLTVQTSHTEKGYISKKGGKWATTPAKTHTRTTLNPVVAASLAASGAYDEKTGRTDLHRRGLLPSIPSRHMTSAELRYRGHAQGTGGEMRGVRKKRGAPSNEESPVSRYEKFKTRQNEYENRYNRFVVSHRDMQHPKTREKMYSPLEQARVRRADRDAAM